MTDLKPKPEDIYDILTKQLAITNIRRVRTQIRLMAQIYEFLQANPEFDYTTSDIRKALHNLPLPYSMQAALFNLHKLDLIKSYRDINGKPAYQLKGWKHLS